MRRAQALRSADCFFEAGHDKYEDHVRQKQMLASAGARLLRPKLAASIAHWRTDWEATRDDERAKAAEVLAAAQSRQRGDLEEQIAALRKELEQERSGAAAERRALEAAAEAQAVRQEEAAAKALMEKLEEERERRIAHLQQSAARNRRAHGTCESCNHFRTLRNHGGPFFRLRE